jgi:hypothetical protein
MSVVFLKFDRNTPFDPEVLSELPSQQLGVIAAEPLEEVQAALEASRIRDRFQFYVRRSDDPAATWELAANEARVTRDEIFYVDPDRTAVADAWRHGVRGSSDVSRLQAVVKNAAALQPNLSGLTACTADAKEAALNNDAGPANETDFDHLLQRLEAAKVRLPSTYVTAAGNPFSDKLNAIGRAGFTRILVRESTTTGALLSDIAQSILQNGERFQDTATDAFEEVVTDLYDGFLSAQDRRGVKKPDRAVLPPLVKWGNPDFGPYTWPSDATGSFGVECAVVNLPPANAAAGLLAWSTLPHETAGHDILHADHGLAAELADEVLRRLQPLNPHLAAYWAERIDETASDVMGILNMGPAAGIGTIAYFRALGDAFAGVPRLRTEGPTSDPHPADILRGYLAAATVALLSFTGSAAWSKAIFDETEKDAGVPTFLIAFVPVAKARAQKSAQIVAKVIATHRCSVLRNHALIDIQDWRDADEAIVRQLSPAITTAAGLPPAIDGAGVFAAHVVAASVTSALAGLASPAIIFRRMIATLKAMHDGNPAWGPAHVVHPSSIYRDPAYVR